MMRWISEFSGLRILVLPSDDLFRTVFGVGNAVHDLLEAKARYLKVGER
jgi:hypothetical protein